MKKLKELYKQYQSGQLEKQQYIDLMHEKHQALFDYYDYIKDTDIESITIDNKSIFITVKGSQIKLLLDRYDRRFLPLEMLDFHSIDVQERGLLFKLAAACSTIIDIGANIGWYSINFARLPKVKTIYAFEPIPYTYDYLTKHLQMNNITKVLANNYGLSEVEGTRTFFWTRSENGAASLSNIQRRSRINKVKCWVTTLDKYLSRRQAKIDLVKCDVEGAELFVFKGAVKTLARSKPIIFTEMLRKWAKQFGYHPDEIIKLLSGLGYCCYGYRGKKIVQIAHVTPELETTNFFFFHETKHKKIIRKLPELK